MTRAQEQLQKEKRAAVAAKWREERANMTPERAAYLKNRRMRYALKTQKKLTGVKVHQLQEQQKELEKEKDVWKK